ncbi:MAG: site-2 protease family protein [Candidatus Marsarchaeota archaeon]|nr:site-2 protease family protein [Candidatus Marsarchaeota archaeon]
MLDKNSHIDGRLRYASGAAVAIVTIAALYYLYFASYLGAAVQWIGALVALVLSGTAIKTIFSLHGGYGMYMLSGSRGIATVRRIAKSHSGFWQALALWGIVLGFGVLAYPLLKGRISKRLYAVGLVSLFIIMFFVLPLLSYSVLFINIAPLQRYVPAAQALPSPSSYVAEALSGGVSEYALHAATFIAGFSGYMFYLLALNSYNILNSVVASISTSSLAPLSSQVPGVAPLIPGVDTPLFAGIIALVVILIFHEMSHGVLAAMFKVKLKSVGLLMFGLIPVGAFVEPEEKQVAKLPAIQQNEILAAGVSSNFLLMLVFLVPMVVMIPYMVQHVYQQSVVITGTIPGYPAYNVIKVDSQVISWNGYRVSDLAGFEAFASNESPGSVINIATSSGSYELTSMRSNISTHGLIGIEVGVVTKAVTPNLWYKSVYFLYTLFALLFMLNFLVAVVNLLPIPGLDGWRIYATSVKNRRIVRVLTALVVIFLLVNVLPWI